MNRDESYKHYLRYFALQMQNRYRECPLNAASTEEWIAYVLAVTDAFCLLTINDNGMQYVASPKVGDEKTFYERLNVLLYDKSLNYKDMGNAS